MNRNCNSNNHLCLYKVFYFNKSEIASPRHRSSFLSVEHRVQGTETPGSLG